MAELTPELVQVEIATLTKAVETLYAAVEKIRDSLRLMAVVAQSLAADVDKHNVVGEVEWRN